MSDDVFIPHPKEMFLIQNMINTPCNQLITRYGSVLVDPTNPFTPSGAGATGRIGNLCFFFSFTEAELLQRVAESVYFNDSGFTEIKGPTGNSAFPTATTSTNMSFQRWNQHVFALGGYLSPQKIYKNSTDAFQIRSAGLPKYSGTPSLSASSGTTYSYQYKFVYKYTYTAGGADVVTYIDRSTPSLPIALSSGAIGTTSTTSISGITYPSNGTTDNWDTASIQVEIYRTEADGSVYYLVTTLANGVTTYSDTTTDANLISGELLYTEGGVLENDPPPKSLFLHIVNDVGYYANLIQDGEKHKNRIRQSKLGITGRIDACPEDFYDDIEEEIAGISSYKSNVIVFGKTSVYRIDGQYDELGRNGMTHERISDITGCVNHDSIVQTQKGVFFAGSEGFYLTDGYTVLKISDNLNDTYARMTSTDAKRAKISGAWEPFFERVWWTVQYNAAGVDNDSTLVLDTRKELGTRSCFTLHTGNSFGPSAVAFNNKGTLYRAHHQGFLFKHDATKFSDPKIDFSLDAANWGTETIIYRVLDLARDLGSEGIRKWVPRVKVCCENDGNLALQIIAYNNVSKEPRYASPIRRLDGFFWGDPNFVWGDPNCVWNQMKVIEEWRHLPAEGLRTNYIQIEVTNAEVLLQNSDSIGKATIDPIAGTVTLDDPTHAWISDANDYFIMFENDGYTHKYLIKRRVSDTVLQLSSISGLSSGSFKWEISGKQKGQVLSLVSFTTYFKPMTQTQTPYAGATGANA